MKKKKRKKESLLFWFLINMAFTLKVDLLLNTPIIWAKADTDTHTHTYVKQFVSVALVAVFHLSPQLLKKSLISERMLSRMFCLGDYSRANQLIRNSAFKFNNTRWIHESLGRIPKQIWRVIYPLAQISEVTRYSEQARLRGQGHGGVGTQSRTDTPVTSLPSENESPALPGGESKLKDFRSYKNFTSIIN